MGSLDRAQPESRVTYFHVLVFEDAGKGSTKFHQGSKTAQLGWICGVGLPLMPPDLDFFGVQLFRSDQNIVYDTQKIQILAYRTK